MYVWRLKLNMSFQNRKTHSLTHMKTIFFLFYILSSFLTLNSYPLSSFFQFSFFSTINLFLFYSLFLYHFYACFLTIIFTCSFLLLALFLFSLITPLYSCLLLSFLISFFLAYKGETLLYKFPYYWWNYLKYELVIFNTFVATYFHPRQETSQTLSLLLFHLLLVFSANSLLPEAKHELYLMTAELFRW